MKNSIKYRWHVISFAKNTLWFLNFKNHSNYTILVPKYFFNSILIQKFIFFIFLSLVETWEMRERGHWILAVEREKCSWHRFRPPKQMIFLSNGSILMKRGVRIKCFFTFKVCEKTYLDSGWFLDFGWFRFLWRFFVFFYAINRFITIPTVFYVFLGQNGLKNGFLDKKLKLWFSNHHSSCNLDKSNNMSFDFFKKIRANIIYPNKIIRGASLACQAKQHLAYASFFFKVFF
jgi:hypothetical protein